MPYGITEADIQAVAAKLLAEYDERRQAGIHSALDRMASAGFRDEGIQSIIQKKIYLATCSFTSFKRDWDLNFNTPLKSTLMRELNVQTGNKMDLVNLGVMVAVKALKAGISKIPVPVLPTLLNMGVDFAAEKGSGVIADKAVVEADTKLSGRTGTGAIRELDISNRDVAEYAKASIDLYKEVARLVTSSPAVLNDFDDIVTFPGVAWRIQKAASSLNISLDALLQYFRQMEARVNAVQAALTQALDTVRNGTGQAISSVLRTTYDEGFAKGVVDHNAQLQSDPNNTIPHYKDFIQPHRQLVTETGAAPHLGMLMAWAFASGYWDAPRTQTRGRRADAMLSRPAPTGPPLPARPTRPLPAPPPATPATPWTRTSVSNRRP